MEEFCTGVPQQDSKNSVPPATPLMRQPLKQIPHMDLVGFVIASERVHHEIDAATEGELVLAVAARHQRIEAFAIRVARPARREIVGGDDDWRDAVAGTGWTQAA